MTNATPFRLETPRLVLCHLTEDDASFILELVNDPDWIRHIGDRKVRTREDAVLYIRNGPIAMVAKEGFGLFRTETKEDGKPVGICGLIRREGLADADLGFAFLPEGRGKGYAREAAIATIRWAKEVAGLNRLVAITSLGNERSIRLLLEVGMRFDGMVRLPGGTEDLRLYAIELSGSS